jgi:hypothetical protein
MIKHIVFFKFKEEACGHTKTENLLAAKTGLEGLLGKVPSLRSMTAGPNAVPGPTSWDFALIAEFDDVDGLRTYTDHPEHKKIAAFIAEARYERAAVDYEL